jgi:hypothetical protein
VEAGIELPAVPFSAPFMSPLGAARIQRHNLDAMRSGHPRRRSPTVPLRNRGGSGRGGDENSGGSSGGAGTGSELGPSALQAHGANGWVAASPPPPTSTPPRSPPHLVAAPAAAGELGASSDACINLAQSPDPGHRSTKPKGAGAVADTQDAPSSHLTITPPTSPGTPGSEVAAGTCSSDSRPWSARAFRDFGCLTFVMCSRGVCVEAQRPGSEHAAWSRLNVEPGDVLLFVGETMEFWTASKLPAVGYRSMPDPNDGGVDQAYTIEFHLNGSEGTEYTPPAALLSDGVAKQQGRCDFVVHGFNQLQCLLPISKFVRVAIFQQFVNVKIILSFGRFA